MRRGGVQGIGSGTRRDGAGVRGRVEGGEVGRGAGPKTGGVEEKRNYGR